MGLQDREKPVAEGLEGQFDRADRRQLEVIDGAFDEGARRAGAGCACRPGCTRT